VDREQLPDWIARFAAPITSWRGSTTLLAGFVELSPQQERLIGALRAAGMEVPQCTTVRADPGIVSRALGTSPRDEVSRALLWARDRALANPGAAIGIAIADLASRRQEVRALAEEILCPALQWRATAGHAPVPCLGAAAADVPSSPPRSISFASRRRCRWDAASLLRSPYVAGDADAGCGGRTRARGCAGHEISMDNAAARRHRCRSAHRLRSARDAWPLPSTATPREWTEFWRSWLAATGWPGDRSLSSDEWQARAVWDELLAQFAMLGAITRRIPAAEAIAALLTQARDHVFQPESRSAAIEILGTLEATGLPLDALWVAGLAAEVWPPAPRPNPFLALSWQRERNAPHATAARELAYAQALTAQWTHGAHEVVFSCAKRRRPCPRDVVARPVGPWLAEGGAARPSQARVTRRRWAMTDERAPSMRKRQRNEGNRRSMTTAHFARWRAFMPGQDRWPEPSRTDGNERGASLHVARDVLERHRKPRESSHFPGQRAKAYRCRRLRRTCCRRRWRRLAAVRASEPTHRLILRAWIGGFDLPRRRFRCDHGVKPSLDSRIRAASRPRRRSPTLAWSSSIARPAPQRRRSGARARRSAKMGLYVRAAGACATRRCARRAFQTRARCARHCGDPVRGRPSRREGIARPMGERRAHWTRNNRCARDRIADGRCCDLVVPAVNAG
jgi:hypothetical protein